MAASIETTSKRCHRWNSAFTVGISLSLSRATAHAATFISVRRTPPLVRENPS
jgi:hypothetical protein